MDKKIFYIRRSNKGLGAILSSRHPRTVIVYAQSPYATRKQNRWLERKLLAVYKRYYYRVLIESSGEFWYEPYDPLKVRYPEEED